MSFVALNLTFALLLISASGLHLLSERKKNLPAIYLFKGLGTILITIYAALLSDFGNSYQLWIVIGLIFSFFGDILLIKEEHFAFGLLSFLIAHIFYIVAFVSTQEINQTLYFPSLTPFVLFALCVGVLIYRNLGKLLIPVGLYIFVIVIMGWQSFNHFLTYHSIYSLVALIGACAFMLSDSLIAINRFRKRLKHERILIMGTYYFGQFLIALSIYEVNV